MLDLDSLRWVQLTAAGGSPRVVVQLLRSLRTHPSDRDWVELFEQLCHQWTLETCAYAALPHVLELAEAQGRIRDPEFLSGIGRVAQPMERVAECPEDLRPDFDSACEQAAAWTRSAASDPGYAKRDYVYALGAAAGFAGRRGPALELFFSLGSSEPEAELECPWCGAYLIQTITAEEAYLEAMDRHMRPISPRAPVRPRERPELTEPRDDQEDFEWLIATATGARQHRVVDELRYLYGSASCPTCAEHIDLADALGR